MTPPYEQYAKFQFHGQLNKSDIDFYLSMALLLRTNGLYRNSTS